MRVFRSVVILVSSLVAGIVAHSGAMVCAAPIEITEVKRDGDVDFEKEILPIFRRNCLACHSATEAQSDLALESPQTILKGGSEGPAVVAGKGAESRLIKLAAQQKEPFMPPPDNDVKAKNLTPAELGLIKLWIDQGAKGEVTSASTQITWQPLPPGINPIYAVAITADGQYAAATRANQIFLYHVPSKRELGRLTDPALISSGIYKQPGVADLDLVQSLKFSPDGTLLASGGFRTVKLWRKPAMEFKPLASLLVAAARVLAISADGKLAAIGQEAGRVDVCEVATGTIAHSLEGHVGPVTGAAFLAGGAKLVTGSLDKSLRVWNTADGKQVAVVETPSAVNAVAIVGEGKQVATAGEDGVIRLWELPTSAADGQKPTKEIKVPEGEVTALAVSANGQRIAFVSKAGGKLWNTQSGQQMAELKGDIRLTLKVGELTRGVALAKKRIELAKKDLEEANERKKAEEENQKKSTEALTKADGEFKPKEEAAKKAAEELAAGEKALAEATSAKAKVDEAKKAADEALAKADEALKSLKSNLELAAKLSGDDGLAAKAAAEKAAVDVEALRKLLEASQKSCDTAAKEGQEAFAKVEEKTKQLKEANQKAVDERTAAQRTLETAKRGVERAAEAVKKATEAIPGFESIVKSREEAAKVREAELAKATTAAKESEQAVTWVAFSPDGLALATVGEDGLVHTWDAETGAAVEVHEGSGAALRSVSYLAGGKLSTVDAKNGVGVWSMPGEWALTRTIGSPDDASVFVDRVTALDFAPGGKVLAAGGGDPSRSGEVKLIDVASGSLVRAIKDPHSDVVNCVAYSPDGLQLATCSADRFIKVWNADDGKFLRAFEGHTHHVLGVSWRADGRVLVSSGADAVLKVWDTRTGDQLRTVQNQFTKEVTSVCFVADGENVVATGGDAKVRLIGSGNGNNQRDFSGPAEYMYSAAVSADGKTIVAGGLDGVLRIWDSEGKELARFAPPPPVANQTAAK